MAPGSIFRARVHPVEMSVKGGSIAPLRVSTSGMRMLDISPDASEMLALKPDLNDETQRGSIWSVPVLGGYPKMVGAHIAVDAHWSPDGHSIVYADLNSLYVSDRDGANLKKIWDAPGRPIWPYFSPDSRRIRVSLLGSKVGDQSKLWELNADGTAPHPLALNWPEDADQEAGQWTPGRKTFHFHRRRMEGSATSTNLSPHPGLSSGKNQLRYVLPRARLMSSQQRRVATAQACS